jgi:acyl carrier protein
MSDVLDQVVRILTEVVGEDFLLDTEITPGTTFSDDLALESIEFVALSEKLHEYYGDQVDFVAFIGGMDIDEIMSMTVGTLTGYIETQLTSWPR